MARIKNALLAICSFLLFSCQSKGQEVFEPEEADAFKEAPAKLSHVLQIAKDNEPGERLVIKGRVFESDGITPAAHVVMYFYHTNAKGVYAKGGNEPRNSLAWWHGYNRGWLQTNKNGEYEIRTIKPAPYPAMIEPAHIHVVIKAPGQKKSYPIGAIVFQGDELITEEYLYNVEQYGHPRDKGVALVLNGNGIWEGKKDFVLYAQYDKTSASSGLLKDEECPAFGPRHVWGRDKGSTACPMCKYGYGQGIMAWINTDSWSNITKLATFLDRKIEEQGADKLRAFLIFMNPERLNPVALEKRLQQFAKENKLKHVAVLCIPSPQDEKSAGLYRINPNKGTRNTVFIYKSRRVFDKYVNFDVSGKNVTAFTESIQKAIQSKQQL